MPSENTPAVGGVGGVGGGGDGGGVGAAITCTVIACEIVPATPLQTIEYVVVMTGDTAWLPETGFVPVQPLEATQDVVFWEVQFIVALAP